MRCFLSYPSLPPFFYRCPWPAAGLLLLLSCHDAPRTNPFDPALTPPVELQVALDDTAGTAILTWSRYAGKQPFEEYRVLRHIAERTRVDTLVHLPVVEQTAFVDTTLEPNTAYVYRVETLNAGGYAAPSEERSIAGFSVGAVRLLVVESDQESGGLVLRWNRYVGPDFASYQVHRRAVGTDREETLAEIAAPTDTTFTDQAAQAGVDYLYTLTVQAAGQDLSSNAAEARLLLPPVLLAAPQFDARTASASLKWTPYTGPHFKTYRVERHTEGLTPQLVAELTDLTSTAYVDTNLVGNTEYFYQVVVETQRDEEVRSEEQRGAFHQLLATWPLAIAEGEYVRLYREGEGITALGASSAQVRLFFFDTQGTLLEEQTLLDNPLNIDPRSVTTSLGLTGQRFLSLNTGRNTTSNLVSVWRFDAMGKPVLKKTSVFADTLGRLSPDYATAQGDIFLLGNIGPTGISFDNVVVSRGGQVLFAEDFEQGDLVEWDSKSLASVVAQGKFTGNNASDVISISKADASFKDFSVEVDIEFPAGSGFTPSRFAGIGVGTQGNGGTRFLLYLSRGRREVRLQWFFTPPEGSVVERQNKLFWEPFFVLTEVPYRLGLEVAEGQVQAWVSSPVLRTFEPEEDSPWASLAGIGESLVLIAGKQSYRINSPEVLESSSLLESQASEVRIWETSGAAAQYWMGVCLPEKQLPAFTKTRVTSSGQLTGLPSLAGLDNTVTVLGTGAGKEAGSFFYPISLDGSQDGRVYVLDAGNARIQVFDIGGKYLTQWGHKGSGEGEFDFGSGRAAEEFAGSVAVDSEGFIYVADVGNKRIQKFAP